MTEPRQPNSGHVVAGTEPTPVNLRREGAIIADVRGADIRVAGVHAGPEITVQQDDMAQTRLPVIPGNLTAIEITRVQKNMTKLRIDLAAHERTCIQCRAAKDEKQKSDKYCDVGRAMIIEIDRFWNLLEPQMRRG